ncbi:ATP synthase subunit I [Tuberibacillus sp. Marseille-P3662]|uniref:ATP synthase subunit I n=1 Tax=Tuberibacillus sp. Marseille-P3662 TaxID=1965358 RepID=UPI000A1CA338
MHNSFTVFFKKVLLSTIICMLVLVLLWSFLPYKKVIQGLFLGISFSLINALISYIKAVQITSRAIDKGKRPTRSNGMLSRFTIVFIAVFITIQYQDSFSLLAVVIGLVFIQLLAPLMALLDSFKRQH